MTNTEITHTDTTSRYIAYLSIFFQLCPNMIPTYVNMVFQTRDPRNVYIENLTKLVLPTPHGREIYVRIAGNNLQKNEILSPYFWNNSSVNSR